MKVLLTVSEGYMLSEVCKVIYSPGYERADLGKSEHECLCIISKLVEARLTQQGHTVLAHRFDDSRQAVFMFDKSRAGKNCDLAIMLALNTSQNPNVQFSTAIISSVQTDKTRNIFEGVMHSLSRFIPIQSRYPNSLKRIPYLESMQRSGTPAVIILPFFYTDKSLTSAKLGVLLEASATAVSEAILAFRPDAPIREVSEY